MASSSEPPKSAETRAESTGPLKPLVELPAFLRDLPTVGFTTRPARSQAESEQKDVLINKTSLAELASDAIRYFNKDKGA